MKTLLKILLYVVLFVAFYVVSVCFVGLINEGSFVFEPSYATNSMTILIFIVLCGIFLIKFMFDKLDGKNKKKKPKGGLSDKGKD